MSAAKSPLPTVLFGCAVAVLGQHTEEPGIMSDTGLNSMKSLTALEQSLLVRNINAPSHHTLPPYPSSHA